VLFFFRCGLTALLGTLALGSAGQSVPLAQAGSPLAGSPLAYPAEPADLSVRFRELQPRVAVPGLRAYWPLDEASGYVARDAAGSADAHLTGTHWNTTASGLTAAHWRAGRRAGALALDGTERLQLRATRTLPAVPRSVGLWVRPERLTSAPLLVWGGLRLETTAAGTLRAQYTDAAGRLLRAETPPTALRAGQWRYLGLSLDPAAGTLTLILDGQLLPPSRGTEPLQPAPLTTDPTVGQAASGGPGFAGLLDEISLFDRPLTPAEWGRLYRTGLPKRYTQTRATIDSARTVWRAYDGTAPVPHPLEPATRLSLSFDETLTDRRGTVPLAPAPAGAFQPGRFGAALDLRALKTPLAYALPTDTEAFTLETYVRADAPTGPLLHLSGTGPALTVGREDGRWVLTDGTRRSASPAADAAPEAWQHLALVSDGRRMEWYLNGVRQGTLPVALRPNRLRLVPGGALAVDDLRLSAGALPEEGRFPHGLVATGAAGLDFRDSFHASPGERLRRWADATGTWRYAPKTWEDDGTHTGDGGTGRGALYQSAPRGRHRIPVPQAGAFAQSLEAGIALDSLRDGWAGLLTRRTADSSYATFALNAGRNQFRLVAYRRGVPVAERTIDAPLRLRPRQTYTLTLTATRGLLRGYLDGQPILALPTDDAGTEPGGASLWTEQTTAFFDDVHHTALTPATADSRLLQTRVWAEGTWAEPGWQVAVGALRHGAFRWQKRPGSLPWAPRGKDPEPPGNLFGPTTNVERPNPTADWRSEDAANSALAAWDGRILYVLRGNPDHGGPHGVAALGVLTQPADRFTGRHFHDVPGAVLRGHPELSPACADAPPRHERYQLNDQGLTLVGNRALVVAREFRNRTRVGNRYKRLVYAWIDPATGQWQTPVPRYADWSVMNAADCFDTLRGLDATPEITTWRDPATNEAVVLLYHKHSTPEGRPANGVTGFRVRGDSLVRHPGYPTRPNLTKASQERAYGQRLLFDNGIYYLHLNAGSTRDRLDRDWPDRFELYTALDPYAGTWTDSRANADSTQPYFTRGAAHDPDNGAIWQGALLKHRGRYYLYYENYHVVENTEQPYDQYDALHSGSRVGFATAN
jgi:hypothetical protein